MKDARKDIIFRDADYKEKFRIKDGDSIKITVSYDGEEIIRKCRFLDEAHMNVGSSCYHMDEFMEKQMRANNQYEPVPNRKPMLDILTVEPGKAPENAEIPLNLAALNRMLGGTPETIPLSKSAAIALGKNGNGRMAICGLNHGELASLHPYDAQMYRHHPEKITEAVAAVSNTPTLQEQLAEAKRAVAAQNQAKGAHSPAKAAQRKKDGAEY
jgi:hypothetical protein